MKRQTRWLIGLAVAFVALALIGVAIQTIRSLLWDLSYFLPPWLLTPLLLLGLVLVGAITVQVGEVVALHPMETVAVRFRRGTFLIPLDRLDPVDAAEAD